MIISKRINYHLEPVVRRRCVSCREKSLHRRPRAIVHISSSTQVVAQLRSTRGIGIHIFRDLVISCSETSPGRNWLQPIFFMQRKPDRVPRKCVCLTILPPPRVLSSSFLFERCEQGASHYTSCYFLATPARPVAAQSRSPRKSIRDARGGRWGALSRSQQLLPPSHLLSEANRGTGECVFQTSEEAGSEPLLLQEIRGRRHPFGIGGIIIPTRI